MVYIYIYCFRKLPKKEDFFCICEVIEERFIVKIIVYLIILLENCFLLNMYRNYPSSMNYILTNYSLIYNSTSWTDVKNMVFCCCLEMLITALSSRNCIYLF